VPIGIVVYGSFWSFPPRTREQVFFKQKGRCADCKELTSLQCHHIVPLSKGGTDSIANAVGLCDVCHDHWDRKALDEGVIYPGIPISRATPKQRYPRGRHAHNHRR